MESSHFDFAHPEPDEELARRREAVARWRGLRSGRPRAEGGRPGSGWEHQRRKIGARRGLIGAAE